MSVITMDKSWKSVLSVELEKEYFQRLTAEISADYLLNNLQSILQSHNCLPP